MIGKKIALGGARCMGMTGLAWLALVPHASAAESLCAPAEQVFFNCRIKDSPKLLSVCGRGAEEAARGAAVPGAYLEYRFGSRDNPELVFPKTREGSLDRFWVATEFVRSAFYESHQLSFQLGGSEYRVYAVSQLADAGPDAPPDVYGGVIVTTAGGGTSVYLVAPFRRTGSAAWSENSASSIGKDKTSRTTSRGPASSFVRQCLSLANMGLIRSTMHSCSVCTISLTASICRTVRSRVWRRNLGMAT